MYVLGYLVGKFVFVLLSKVKDVVFLKDLWMCVEKDVVLVNLLILNCLIFGEGCWDILLFDDLYDSGVLVDVVCDVLCGYEKIGDIFVVMLMWR